MKMWQKLAYYLAMQLCLLVACCTAASAADSKEEMIAEADMVLCFKSLDEIDIGVSTQEGEQRTPRFFRRDQLEVFFEGERRKELIVVSYPEQFKAKQAAREFLKSLKYKSIFECTCEPTAAYEIRKKAERNFPLNSADAKYHHLREVRAYGSLNEIDIGLGTVRSLDISSEKAIKRTYVSKDELHAFLSQDTQRGYLLVHWSKYYQRTSGSLEADEEIVRNLATSCKFVSTKFAEDFGMFQVEPTIISP